MAVLRQERHVELVPGANELFVITNEMFSAVIPDELPHLNIFVMSVTDVDDPTSDTLARVANIADLTLIPIGRDAGILAPGPNGIEWLSSASTSSYETLETANDAAVAFQDRVNAIIEGWITFRTEFNAPDPTPASYTLPRVDASQKEALIAAYAAAKQAGYTQLQVKNAADATLLIVQADYTYKQSLVTGIQTIFTDATKVQGGLATVITQFGVLLTAGSVFAAANPAGTGIATFNAALALATGQQAAMPGYNTDANTLVADVTNYQTARQNDVITAATNVGTAQSNQISQQQLLTAANATTAAALAAVLAVCPDFDPTSIPFVPG
jgi:hypothetical protein